MASCCARTFTGRPAVDPTEPLNGLAQRLDALAERLDKLEDGVDHRLGTLGGSIEEKFGQEVGEIVAGCTDTDQTPKPPWRERKEKYITHLKTASASTRLVSAADKLHNTRAIVHNLREDGEEVWERFKAGKEGALWYYRSLVTAFREHGDSPLIDELDRVVTEMERLAGK